jgi:pimeloyl-[acyl-carrier protein] synthase
MTALSDHADYDLYGASVIADPYPTYTAMRAAGPLVRVGRVWYVTTYALADQVFKDQRFGRGEEYIARIRDALGPGPLFDSLSRWILFLDPPDHTRIRSLVMRAFTPRAVSRLRATVQAMVDELVNELVDELDGRPETDFLRAFAYPLPVQVICGLLGVPADDREDFKTWSADLGRGLQIATATPEIVRKGNVAAAKLGEYFRGLIDERRASPGDGFLDDLIAAEYQGGSLTEDELLATVGLIFFAGHETTVNLIGNGLVALLRARTEWEALCADPGLARPAVEEMLRFDTPVQRATRVALEDVEVAGQRVLAGDLVDVIIGGANRDPAQFPDPDRFVIGRANGPHLSFAAGPHYCAGATLARLEAEIAMATLAQQCPGLALAAEELTFRPNVILRGLASIPVTRR